MKQISIYLVAILLVCQNGFTQDLKFSADWSPSPSLHKVEPSFAGYEAVIIEEAYQLEYKDEGKETVVYITEHRIAKAMDDKGIEMFNKMKFSLPEANKLVTLKARTILPNGKVIEVEKDKIKQTQDEYGLQYLVFAMEGVEKNAEIEYVYCYKKTISVFGGITYQYSIPVQHAFFQIVSPTRIKFEGKGYSGFPDAADTIIEDKRYLSAEKYNIAARKSETYAFEDLNAARIEYKISYYPTESPGVRMYTWQLLVNRLYERYHTYTKSELQEVDKFLEQINVTKDEDEPTKIRKIESAIKTNITLYRQLVSEDAFSIHYILSKKSANDAGFCKLFAACFKQAGVNAELGVTVNRFNHQFDANFENWNNMVNSIFYFPNLKKFLSPAEPFYRYPFVPASCISSKGLFCKPTTLGDITSAVADIKPINVLPANENHNDIDAVINFNSDFEALELVTVSMTGYCAIGIRETIMLLPKEKLSEFVALLLNTVDKPSNLLTYNIINKEFENYYDNKPLQINGKIKVPQLVEKAGPKYIFKLGDIIGKQQEMYESKERSVPIDIAYNHFLNRKIVVNIPDGYKILNPENIVFDAAISDADGKETTAFHSSYTIEGNKLSVIITEFYNVLHMPAGELEPFRKVVNASADFNKVNLVIAKQ